MAGDAIEVRWWRARPEDRLTVLEAALQECARWSTGRMARYERAHRLFSTKSEVVIGRNLATPARIDLNLVRTIALTARSHLTEYAPPRGKVVTSGGDYQLQQRAEGLSKFSVGVMHRNEADDSIRGKVALRSAVMGTGLVRVGSKFGRITVEPVAPWHVLAHRDDEQSEERELRTMYLLRSRDRGELQALFPAHKRYLDKISSSARLIPWIDRDQVSLGRVWTVEAWHLPSGPEATDGRRLIAVEGKMLADEEWQGSRIPLIPWHWAESTAGWWGEGIADNVGELQRQLYTLMQRLQQAIDLTTNPRLLAPIASRPRPWPPTNEAGAVLWYNGNVPPAWDVARAVSPELAGQIERVWSKGFQMEGVSELTSMALKPAGVNSGEAIRAYADKTSGRLAPWSTGEQKLHQRVTEEIIAEGRRLAEKDPEFSVVASVDGQVERVFFDAVDLEEDAYLVRAEPVSSLPESIPGRMAVLQEYAASGVYSPDQVARLSRNPDLEADQKLREAPLDWARKVLSEIAFGSGVYTPPEPLDDLEGSKLLCKQIYAKARSSSVEPARLSLLRRWAKELDALLPKPPPPPGPPALPPGPVPPEMMAPPPGAEGPMQ